MGIDRYSEKWIDYETMYMDDDKEGAWCLYEDYVTDRKELERENHWLKNCYKDITHLKNIYKKHRKRHIENIVK